MSESNGHPVPKLWHSGGCHCQAVRFEVQAPAHWSLVDCNCSICRASGFLHLIVPAADFKLLSGQAALVEYRFNSRQARHLSCRHCGVKSFYVPRSHPDGFSVNARCVSKARMTGQTVRAFDGANWEQSVEGLRAST